MAKPSDDDLEATPNYLKPPNQMRRGNYLGRLAWAETNGDTRAWLRTLREYHTHFGGQIEPELVVPPTFFAQLVAQRATQNEMLGVGDPAESMEMTFRRNTTIRPPRGEELESTQPEEATRGI